MNQFFLKDNPKLFEEQFDEKGIDEYLWIISADKIFAGYYKEFPDFARINHISYQMYKSFLYNQTKTAESSVFAKEVHIYMPSGSHCAMLEGRMAKSIIIPTITIQKISVKEQKQTVLEKKEFKQCVINAFAMQDHLIGFSFRYTSLNDSYTKFKEDGTQEGSAATQIDFVKWEIKAS